MLYKKFAPAPDLALFVECYYLWRSEGEVVQNLVVESPPNGFCSIVFNGGDPYYLQNKKYQQLVVPACFIAGQAIYSYQLFLNGTINLAGIVLKPAALATLFDLPTYQYTEERVDLAQVFPAAVVESFAVQIKAAMDENTCVQLLEKFLRNLMSKPPEPDYIDTAANAIVERNGMLQVTDLLADSCMSRRTFERHFFKKVGLSPKYYARIRRIGYLCNLVAGKKKVDWAKIFYECEFYDQAHFIKDFEAFTGRTPQQYLKENTELANLVEKPIVRHLH